MIVSPALAFATLLPMPREQQKRVIKPPEGPYLDPASNIFFTFLLKTGEHNYNNKLSKCIIEWERVKRNCGLPLNKKAYDFDKYILKKFGKDIINKTTIHGVDVVILTPYGKDWAEKWSVFYRTYRGHHSAFIALYESEKAKNIKSKK